MARAYILATFEPAPEEEALTQALLMLAANSPAIFAAKQSELTELAPPTPYDQGSHGPLSCDPTGV